MSVLLPSPSLPLLRPLALDLFGGKAQAYRCAGALSGVSLRARDGSNRATKSSTPTALNPALILPFRLNVELGH